MYGVIASCDTVTSSLSLRKHGVSIYQDETEAAN